MISGISSSMMDYLTPYRAGMAMSGAGRNARGSAAEGEEEDASGVTPDGGRNAAGSGVNEAEGKAPGAMEELSKEEVRQVEELAKTDRKVRQHEQAHMAVGGSLVTSGASYEYQTGPDGKRYAIGGEVGISLAKGRTPEETLQRARQIRAAALAPADPSPQDQSVAAAAAQMEMQAMQEIAAQRLEESKQGDDGTAAPSPVPPRGAEESANAASFAGIQAYRKIAGTPEPGTGLGAGGGMTRGSLLSIFA